MRCGAEKRFTVSLNIFNSYLDPFTQKTKQLHPSCLCQDSPSAPGTDSHAIYGECFVIDDQDSELLPNISGQYATLAIFSRYVTPLWSLLPSVLVLNVQMIAA